MNQQLVAIDTLLQVDPEFVELCKMLYGDGIDAEMIWEDICKMSPDQSEVHARGQKRDWTKTVSRASNVLGMTAGAAAVAPTLADSRLKHGGRVSRGVQLGAEKVNTAVRATKGGRKYASWAKNPKNAAKVAAGAAGLQVANVAGDVITSRVLGRKERMKKGAKLSFGQKVVSAATKYPSGTAAVGITGTGGTVYASKRAARNRKIRQYAAQEMAYEPAVKRDDVEWTGEFSKVDTDKHLAFGWASVTSVNGIPIVDKQGDYIHPDDLEDAAYSYVVKSRKGGDMHRRISGPEGDVPFHASDLVESFVLTPEKIEKMGLPRDTRTGWWVGFKFHDEDTWQDIKKGKRTGFSIHGRGHRREVDYDETMAGV